MEEHEGPLTADYQRFYHQRLSTSVCELPYQETLDMIRWLPQDSAFRAAVASEGDPEKAARLFEWGSTQDLLLSVVNRLTENTWVTAQAASKKKIRPPQPVSGPRGKPPRSGDASAMARGLLSSQQG